MALKFHFYLLPIQTFFIIIIIYFVTCTVKKLLKFGRIKETRVPPYIVSPLTVAKHSHNKSPSRQLHVQT